jgi:serine/threonine-protein kinase RsbW
MGIADSSVQTSEEVLVLQSELGDLARVPPWIERMACAHAIPPNTEFAMNLCLEELLSNIIRHGYSNEPGHAISICFSAIRKNEFELAIEDQALPFDPLTAAISPLEETLEGRRRGGLGIRLVRSFAGSMKYEALAGGNRLTLRFSAPVAAAGGAGE